MKVGCDPRCRAAKAFIGPSPWMSGLAAAQASLRPVRRIDPVHIDELVGIAQQKEQLARNTRR